jgi:hypothetical protein
MDRQAAEANLAIMNKMLNVCRQKVVKTSHGGERLTDDE